MVSVTRNGTTIDDLVSDQEVQLVVGRRTVLDSGEAGFAAITLWLTEWIEVNAGDIIEVTEGTTVRFVGKVSDIPNTWWEDDETAPAGRMMGMRVLAVGPLAAWGRSIIGDEPWPAETIAERAARISALAGDPLIVQGGQDTRVIARDVDARTAIDVLADLATDASGWLYDHAGTTYLQSLDSRRNKDPVEVWSDQDHTWAAWAGTWAEQTEAGGTAPRTVHLPADAVLFAPPWAMQSQITNNVRVQYGPPDPESDEQAEVILTDPVSIAIYGQHDVRIQTRLESPAEAVLRAQLTLERAAHPRWHLPSVQVAWELMDPGSAAELDAAMPGNRVSLDHMPMPGPSTGFTGVLEGWSETWMRDTSTGDMQRTSRLHLSDLRWSFAVLTWAEIPPAETWDSLPPGRTWEQMLTIEDLEAV